MINGSSLDEHHLIPKKFGGKVKEKLHRVCHMKIHSCIDERSLAKVYYTWDALLGHSEIQKFVKWVKNKDPEFFTTSRETETIKKRKKKRR